MQKLIEAGVISFKIEGRMRRAEYVGAAVKYYRFLIDEQRENIQLFSDLKRTYNRGNYTKGLAFGQNKNCLGVSTLEALAENLVPFDGIICHVMNARRGQVYNALFRYEGGTLRRLCEDRALSVADLAAELAEIGEPFALCGDGVDELSLVHF